MWEQVELLEYHSRFKTYRPDIRDIIVEYHVIDPNFTRLVFFQPIDTANQGRLTGAGGATYHYPVTAIYRQIDVL